MITREGKIYANFEIEGVEVAGTVDQYFAELQAEISNAEKECKKAVRTIAVGLTLTTISYILHFFL
jgi:hypothetical protein